MSEERSPLRELDARIAVELLGWTGPVEWRAADAPYPEAPLALHPEWPDSRSAIPHYSKDIKFAWLAVEAMAARGWQLQLNYRADSTHAHFWRTPASRRTDRGFAFCPTPPEAIVRAALAALEQSAEGAT